MDPKKALTLAAAAAALLLAGCTHVRTQVTPLNFSADAMEIIGPAQGESVQHVLVGLIPSDDAASVVKATKAALESVKGDALLNPIVDDETVIGFLGIIQWKTIRVHGTAVRFKKTR